MPSSNSKRTLSLPKAVPQKAGIANWATGLVGAFQVVGGTALSVFGGPPGVVFGGALVASGVRGVTYAITTDNDKISTSELTKRSIVGGASGLAAGGVGALAGTGLSFTGNFIVSAVGGLAAKTTTFISEIFINEKPPVFKTSEFIASTVAGAVSCSVNTVIGSVAATTDAADDVATAVAKFALNTGVGATSGAVSGATSQFTTNIITGEKNISKDLKTAAITGASIATVSAVAKHVEQTNKTVEPKIPAADSASKTKTDNSNNHKSNTLNTRLGIKKHFQSSRTEQTHQQVTKTPLSQETMKSISKDSSSGIATNNDIPYYTSHNKQTSTTIRTAKRQLSNDNSDDIRDNPAKKQNINAKKHDSINHLSHKVTKHPPKSTHATSSSSKKTISNFKNGVKKDRHKHYSLQNKHVFFKASTKNGQDKQITSHTHSMINSIKNERKFGA